MKIKMKMDVNGTFHNMEGVKLGDVVDVDDAEAERYIALGYAEAAKQRRSEEHAVQEFSNEERAVLDTEIIGASHGAVHQSKLAQGRHDDPEPVVLEVNDEPEPEPEPVEEPVKVPVKRTYTKARKV